ncbi:MAG: orotidine-5'-phosphate decarboxylase [Bacteroidia bacterium]|nr:orotidine-5'-phosphate decarboxylase [Bacteroidia bacterium]
MRQKKSFLCVGIDPELSKLPQGIPQTIEGLRHFLQEIIPPTLSFAVATKINLAFFESLGSNGWKLLETVLSWIPPHILTIADAKRGDIGNTSRKYAEAFFQELPFDGITVNPYMGADSVKPFLDFPNKWTFLLGLTSNIGAEDFQLQRLASGQFLYESVIETAQTWGNQLPGELGFVVGATRPEYLQRVRKITPQSFLLVPGIGAQGGDLPSVLTNGLIDNDFGLLINASRSILYASSDHTFVEKAVKVAQSLQTEMAAFC